MKRPRKYLIREGPSQRLQGRGGSWQSGCPSCPHPALAAEYLFEPPHPAKKKTPPLGCTPISPMPTLLLRWICQDNQLSNCGAKRGAGDPRVDVPRWLGVGVRGREALAQSPQRALPGSLCKIWMLVLARPLLAPAERRFTAFRGQDRDVCFFIGGGRKRF